MAGKRRGVLVEDVVSGSPAAKAGLKGGGGAAADLITKLDGKPLTSIDALTRSVSGKRPGDRLTLGVTRDGKAHTVTVRLGVQPAKLPG
jgi:S1-C subfamily serine protease